MYIKINILFFSLLFDSQKYFICMRRWKKTRMENKVCNITFSIQTISVHRPKLYNDHTCTVKTNVF